MFLSVVLVSVAVAWLRGGRIERLASFPFQHIWLVFAAFGIQVVLHLKFLDSFEPLRRAAPYLYVSAYYLLLICFFINRRAPGVLWLAAGALSNLVVIAANAGRMPVSGEALIALGFQDLRDAIAAGRIAINCVITPATRLPWLGDVLVGSPPLPRPALFSLGDVFLSIGVFALVQGTMVGRGGRAERAGQRAAGGTGPARAFEKAE